MKYDKITMEEILNGFNILKRKNRKKKEKGSYRSKTITFEEWLLQNEKIEQTEDELDDLSLEKE